MNGYKTKHVDYERLALMLSLGVPKTKIARSLGLGRTTLYRILQEMSNERS